MNSHPISASRTALALALGLCLYGAAAHAQDTDGDATTLDRIEVTGSRIKRADIEGALPITTISREEIELSGRSTVADVLQSATFNSFGSFVPSSGSSAQSFSGLSLRGLGEGRTLILINGRRVPVSPVTGEGQDLNSLPLAAVERIEILSDGASAIYGADAIGGVVNIITRKDFEGVQVSAEIGQSERGGSVESGSATFGLTHDRGYLTAGVSYSNRGITYWRDYPWVQPGASTYSNNYVRVATNPETGERVPGAYLYTNGSAVVPGGCSGDGFYTNASGSLCYYDFVPDGADTASVNIKGAFARGEYQLSDDWSLYMDSYYTKKDSMGVYAPVPEFIFVPAGSPNNTTGQDAYIKHRFDALGNRITYQYEDTYDLAAGLRGQLNDTTTLEVGVRNTQSKVMEAGYNYVNIPVAEKYFADGTYNAFCPSCNAQEVLDAIRTTTGRNTFFKQQEFNALLSADLFRMAGGASALALGAEYRQEDYQDIYDQQSAAGNVGGSSGNSAWGDRTVSSVFAEWNLPFLGNLEADLAVRYDHYSDFGDATSPKLSLRYQPIDTVTLRASYGEGFRAPTLQALNQQPAFSADSVTDAPTALAYGLPASTSLQINAYHVANPNLKPETSEQFSAGVAWDATDWLNLTLDYYKTRIDDQIKWYSSQTVIDRTNEGQYLPDHLYVVRNEDGSIQAVYAGYGNEGQVNTDGLDLNVRARFDLAEWGRLSSELQGSWVHSYKIKDIDGDDEYVGTHGYPEWRAVVRNRWDIGDFSLAWNINLTAYNPAYYVEYYDSCAEAVEAGDADRCSGAYVTHDVQFAYKTPWNGQVAIGAVNVTNKDPVYDPAYTEGFYDYLYNGYGRQVYLRYTQNF
ncbi:TonB-dependent receptor plug domain-containing protein [Vulcaniibacterium tengchongense]|uniref:Iron complex outermembrane receptor protein n=1 Tax=Vulcaniibacterium tengchongense TaxID=1273429 RepID=A0A3N4UYV1_9GAMM|nr:TonB-dependent receptor [Vulcaniibacterium tengchongense]RPE75902.1 iron complex outermembrane receptor protein [Vulcaniibacterium tengchongense]